MKIRTMLVVLTVVGVLASVSLAAGRARNPSQGRASQNPTTARPGASVQAPCDNTGMGARWGGQGFGPGRLGAGGGGYGNRYRNGGGNCQGGGGQQIRQRLRDGSCGQTCPVQR